MSEINLKKNFIKIYTPDKFILLFIHLSSLTRNCSELRTSFVDYYKLQGILCNLLTFMLKYWEKYIYRSLLATYSQHTFGSIDWEIYGLLNTIILFCCYIHEQPLIPVEDFILIKINPKHSKFGSIQISNFHYWMVHFRCLQM